jgi:hypothetical protein
MRWRTKATRSREREAGLESRILGRTKLEAKAAATGEIEAKT